MTVLRIARRRRPVCVPPRQAQRAARGRPAWRVSSLSARFWHFVEIEPRPRRAESGDPRSAADLRRAARPRAGGRTVLVTPRLGTISPWSSKATDIARQCGLGGRPPHRARHGVSTSTATGDLGAILPLLHDRMTETVLRLARRGRRAVPSRRAEAADRGRRARRGAARRSRRPTRRSAWRWRPTRSTTSSRTSRARGRNPDRRRADDVRAGELGALPPQDLQRVVDRSTASRRPSRSSAMIRTTHAANPQGTVRRPTRTTPR